MTDAGEARMTDDDLIETFLAAQAAFTERVHAVAGNQWPLGTPDAQWTVADLVGHLVDEHRWAGPLLDGLDMDAARAVVARWGPPGRDGDTLVPAWDQAAAMSVVMRETTSPNWSSAVSVGNVTTATLNISKDNVQFGLRAVDRAGHRSPAAFPAVAN